jgi:hypothetical protein
MLRYLIGGSLLGASLAWAEVEVLPLRHRTADELLPVLRPLMSPEGAVSGMNNQLILRGSPESIEEIRALLPRLDVPPRRLRITVMQDVDEVTMERLRELSGSVGGRHARVGVAGVPTGGGVAVEAGRNGNGMRGSMQDGQLQREDHKTQQVQVMEGGRALVRVGQAQPVTQRQQWVTPQGQIQVMETTQYREASSGFYVQPRLSGERVTLEITARNDAPAPEAGAYAQVQQVSTTISGELGAWLVLSDLSQQASGERSAVGSRANSSARAVRRVLLKVDEVR